jgi:hypothetical protein
MTRERRATFLTAAVMIALLGVGLERKASWRVPDFRAMAYQLKAAPPEPQDTIYATLNAARAGDVQRYLANYTGAMERALKQAVAESGEASFTRYLIQSNEDVKGLAVGQPEKVSNLEVKVRVEAIYQDRNEAQTMYLEKGPGGWKISRADSNERVKTLVPYGTPVR